MVASSQQEIYASSQTATATWVRFKWILLVSDETTTESLISALWDPKQRIQLNYT